MTETISPRALCTLDDVKEFVGGFEPGNADSDDLLTRELNAASDEIHRYSGREFVSYDVVDPTVAVPSVLRKFSVGQSAVEDDERGLREWVLAVGDLSAKPTLVTVKDYDGTVLYTLDTVGEVDAALVLEPLRRQPWQPIAELRFLPAGLSGAVTLAPTYMVEVTAKWGFPLVPATIRKAAYTQTALWYARDVRKYATVFSLETGRFQARPRPLDDAIREMVDELRVPTVA